MSKKRDRWRSEQDRAAAAAAEAERAAQRRRDQQIHDAAMRAMERPERYPGLPDRARQPVAARIWQHHAFSAWATWSLHRDGDAWWGRRIVWARGHHVIGAIDPALFGAEARIEPEISALVDRLYAQRVPALPPADWLGLDGTFFGLELGGRWQRMSLVWWSDPPEPWAEIIEIGLEIARSIESALPASGQRYPPI